MGVDKVSKTRSRTAYAGTIVGITLVLFMLGVLGGLMLNAKRLSDHLKENIRVQLFLHYDQTEAEVMQFRKELDTEEFTRETHYVTADQAAEQLKEDLGEDFLEVLGSNPLLPSIEMTMNAAYASPDSLNWIVEHLQQDKRVQEVAYNATVVKNIDRNMGKVGIVLLAFSILLLVISIALINNTIRLAIYSKRMLIRTMDLVGATSWFIKRPFLGQSLVQGIIASILAIGLLMVLYRLTLRYFPDLRALMSLEQLLIVFGGVVVLGIVITLASTWFAVRKYLRMNTEDLY